jgi:hypothetical protein
MDLRVILHDIARKYMKTRIINERDILKNRV